MNDLAYVHKWVDNQSTRTLLLLHGTGGNENDLLSLGETLDSSANYLSLRGNSRDEGSNRFFRRLAEGVLDEEDLKFRTEELRDFLLAAETRHVFKLSDTIAVGYSNGANIAASLLLMYPGSIGGAVLLRAMAPFRTAPDPKGPNSPVLVLAGTKDPIVSEKETTRLVNQLESCHCKVSRHLVQAGHELTRKDVELASEWLLGLGV